MKLRLLTAVVIFFLLIPILPFFVSQVESGTSTNTLYAHTETTTIGGVNYYLHKLSTADGPATILSESAATTGRKLMGKWVYPLTGIVSIPASTWTVTYRAKRSASAKSVEAHCDIDILIRKSDNTIRSTIATNVANSPTITLVDAWQTLTGTYDWAAYTVVDQTDYLEVHYYIEVTTPQTSKYVRLLVDDDTLPLADQTKIENVVFTYSNQPPVASFTFSPSDPVIFETVTFNASASYDPDGSIVSYAWNFGDGNTTTVTDPIITHVYTTAESTVNYTVTLTVTDNEGSTGFTTQIVPVTNPAILHISLPAGTYVGSNPDKWLDECWLLNISDHSGTFTLRINNTSGALTSYDTHLIIALNDAGYNNLLSLTVNATTIPQDAFKYGEPKPYNLYTWPSGDVYPTWFNDTLVNVGIIPPKGYVDVTVSVAFSNATGARIHFDAYGSKNPVPPPPDTHGKITHNPLSADSTVLFWPPPVVKYQLTVRTSGLGTYITNIYNGTTILGTATDATPYTGLFEEGSLILLNIDSPVTDSSERKIFTEWSGDATGTNRPLTLIMSSAKDITANYKTQYLIVFTQSGLDDTATGVIVTINSVNYEFTDLPYSIWADESSTFTYLYQDIVSSSTSGKRFKLVDVSGPPSPFTVTCPVTVTGNYITQYYLTVTSPFGTPSGENWYEAGATAHAGLDTNMVDHGNGTRRVFTDWSGNATGANYAQSNPIIMDAPKTAIANWKTQYLLTVQTNPPGLSPQPLRDPAGEPGPPNSWWYDATTSVTLTAQTVSGYTFTHWNVDGLSQGAGVTTITVTMDAPHTATAHYVEILSASISPPTAKLKIGESVTFTSTVSGGVPPYSYQWYLNGSAVPGAVHPEWTFKPTLTGFYIVYLNVTDSLGTAAKSNEATVTVAPPLTVSISPTSASILVGQSVTFTSTVSGGYPPYTFQWYLNGAPVSGATSNSWTFTPTSAGIYYVYLKVTDANNNTAQSETARITGSSVPVGGYSISLAKKTQAEPIAAYASVLGLFGALLSLTKRKRK